MGNAVKDVELKLVSELIKNSRRSDRELARVLGLSQPTVGRMIKKLEKRRNYTRVYDDSRHDQVGYRDSCNHSGSLGTTK